MKILLVACLLTLAPTLACTDSGSQEITISEADLRGEEAPEELGSQLPLMEAPVAPPRKTIRSLPKLMQKEGITLDLINPQLATEQAPESFRVKLVTTKGDIVVECVRDWAPRGADRFYNLVKIDFFRDIYFHRVVDGFVAQFGIYGETTVAQAWNEARIRDDVPKQSNRRGYLSFSKYNNIPHSRTTEIFINLADNEMLDQRDFAPFARIVSGLSVADRLYSGYGEGFPAKLLRNEGNEGARAVYDKADRLLRAEFVEPEER